MRRAGIHTQGRRSRARRFELRDGLHPVHLPPSSTACLSAMLLDVTPTAWLPSMPHTDCLVLILISDPPHDLDSLPLRAHEVDQRARMGKHAGWNARPRQRGVIARERAPRWRHDAARGMQVLLLMMRVVGQMWVRRVLLLLISTRQWCRRIRVAGWWRVRV